MRDVTDYMLGEFQFRSYKYNCLLCSTYSCIVKGIEKIVLCRIGVVMHSGKTVKILEKRVKHSDTPHASVYNHTITARNSFSITYVLPRRRLQTGSRKLVTK